MSLGFLWDGVLLVNYKSGMDLCRYPNIEKTHLVKLLQQLLIHDRRLVATMEQPHSRIPTAADAPTLLGSGAFSLLDCE
jgi:PH-interacting protein